DIPVNTARSAQPPVVQQQQLTLRAQYLYTVGAKASQHPLLQLRKSCEVECNLIVEHTHAAANYCAPVEQREQCEADSRRQIIFPGQVVAVIAHAVFKRQSAIDGPLVCEVTEEGLLVTTEL